MPSHQIEPAAIDRFRADFPAIVGTPHRLGVAVSGGPDSLALLLLAAAAFPGRVEAATVDHGLRPESAGEASHVAAVCARLEVPHATLRPDWIEPPSANLQSEARLARYEALCVWSFDRGLSCVATGHHLDDQAETLLLRLARGAGSGGLSGIRPRTLKLARHGSAEIVRPLLGWRRADLAEIVAAAGVTAIQDPSNADRAFDRTHARALLAETPWLRPERLAASAAALLESDEALKWVTERVFEQRGKVEPDGAVSIDPHELPRELQRRLLLRALWHFTDERAIPGPKLMRLLDLLLAGQPGTVAGVLLRPGPRWRLSLAPARRDTLR